MATAKSAVQRYLLLPPRGLQTSASPASAHLGTLMAHMQPARALPAALSANGMKVLDSVHANGIKLVEMDATALRALREQAPGLRIVPEMFYRTARLALPEVRRSVAAAAKSAQAAKAGVKAADAGAPAAAAAAAAAPTVLRFVGSNGKPAAGATVVAFTDFAQRIGAQGKTRADGSVSLKLGGATRIQRLYVYPHDSLWSLLKSNVSLPATKPLTLQSIDLAAKDTLQHFAALGPKGDGKGVVVGIIDTGSGPHRDVPVAGGANTVTGENEADFQDNGDLHGTHVAGIVGARGTAPSGMRGLAPAATLRAYRVFGKNSSGASNFAIAKAIDRAVADGCDIINMSLGGEPGGPADAATSAAIADARAAGVVVVCAAGNDGAAQLSQPGADSRAVAVGAFGRKGLMPADSVSAGAVGKLGKDTLNFMADFSNHNLDIDFAGPGVGVVSTVPGDRWAVMDGTSMASPALAGAVARLLSTKPALLKATRDQKRSDAILKLAFDAAKQLGFGPAFEGSGWPAK